MPAASGEEFDNLSPATGLVLGRTGAAGAQDMDRAIAADPARYDGVIAGNQAALEAAGHWGVPTMVFEGEPFFGQDRIELLLWRLRQYGVERRG